MKKLVKICRNGETSQVGDVSLLEVKAMFATLINLFPSLSQEDKDRLKSELNIL